MNFCFNPIEINFMYNHFKDEIRLLELQKGSTNSPIDLEQRLKFCRAIIDEFERVCPDLLRTFDKIEEQIHS